MRTNRSRDARESAIAGRHVATARPPQTERFARRDASSPDARAADRRPRISRQFRPRFALTTLAIATLALAGCSTRHDLDYNRYAPPGGRPTLLQTADHLADLPGRALDNLDERIENAVY